MIEWSMLVMSGMLGSVHCLGMCGPFTLVLGVAAPNWRANLRRQIAYSAGRIFTYAVLGAAAGFTAARLVGRLPGWSNVPAALAIVAGAILIWQGLVAVGMIRPRGVTGAVTCPGGAAFRSLLAARNTLEAFLAGLFTGLLPCGLLYGMLAYAASLHDVRASLVAMVAFGIGTVPAMVVGGFSGSLLGVTARRRLHTVAAWCLVATGVVSLARGLSFVTPPGLPPAGCPFCDLSEEAAMPASDGRSVKTGP